MMEKRLKGADGEPAGTLGLTKLERLHRIRWG